MEAADLETQLADRDLWVDGPHKGELLRARYDKAQKRATELFARWEDLVTRQDQ